MRLASPEQYPGPESRWVGGSPCRAVCSRMAKVPPGRLGNDHGPKTGPKEVEMNKRTIVLVLMAIGAFYVFTVFKVGGSLWSAARIACCKCK